MLFSETDIKAFIDVMGTALMVIKNQTSTTMKGIVGDTIPPSHVMQNGELPLTFITIPTDDATGIDTTCTVTVHGKTRPVTEVIDMNTGFTRVYLGESR